MKRLLLIAAMAVSTSVYAYGFLTGERVDGINKICYYDTPSGTVAITIKAYKVCPVSID